MDKAKMLKMMRFWLFGTFVIVFTAATLYTGTALGLGLLIMKDLNYWLAVILSAALCVAAYFGYKWWLNKKA
jgi:hypothetical protein